MGATPEALMAIIHQKTADRLLAEITNPESDPRYVQMAIKFLSDNNVKMVPEVENELGELDKHLQRRKQRKFGGDNIADFAKKQAEAMNE